MSTPYAPTRLERTTVVTERGHLVLGLLRAQWALPAGDDAGRAAIEHQLVDLLDDNHEAELFDAAWPD